MTNCPDVELVLGPYLDSELDARTTTEVTQHLRSCPQCSARLAEERALNSRLKSHLNATATKDEELWEAVEATVLKSRAEPESRPRCGHDWLYWLWPSPRFHAALAMVWLALLSLQLASREDPRPFGPSRAEFRSSLAARRQLVSELLGPPIARSDSGGPPPGSGTAPSRS